MSHILIAGRPIGTYAKSRFGHLFLALSEDLVLSDDDLVIRAGPNGSPVLSTLQGQIGVQLISTNDSFENVGNLLGITDEQAREYYAVSEIQVADYDAVAIWSSFSIVASQILANEFTYSLFSENSNSFVGTLLSLIGIEPTETAWLRYPGVSHDLSQNYFTGTNYSYVIAGSDTSEEATPLLTPGDRLFALSGSSPFAAIQTGDFVTTFGGNDELHDGNRRDTLEGGTGNDRYILLDDSAADIIISGEGDDVIEGGGAEDRIVLRIDILDQMYDDQVALGSGASDTDLERSNYVNAFVSFHKNIKIPPM